MMIKALGFMPDAESTTPGAFMDCQNIIPTLTGFASSPSLTNAGTPNVAEPVRGSGLVLLLDNTRRLFVATPTAIYESLGSTWTDVSRPGGYTSGGENRFRFAQFGNATIVANQTDKLQASTGAAFDDIPEAPKARIVETVAGFVMAFATDDPVNGDLPDGWWCSGLYNHMAWTPSQATQAANGRFIDSPGEIRAAKKLGGDIVAYKEKSMYLGRYAGPPVIWTWQQLPGEIGALSQESVVSIDTAHVFIGNDDFWLFDGSRPVPIGAPVREWFFSNSSPQYRYRTIGYYDRFNSLVYWYFVSKRSSDGSLDDCLVYHTKTGKWGRVLRDIQAVVEYVSQGLTYDTLGTKYPTFDDITDISYDSTRWFAQGSNPAVFSKDGDLMLVDGDPQDSMIETHDIGDDGTESTITGTRLSFIKKPASGALTSMYKVNLGDDLVNGPSATLYNGRFDYMWASNWHRSRMDFMGRFEFTGYDIRLVVDGER